MVSAPSAPALATMPLVWNRPWPASASVTVNEPAVPRSGDVASSVTVPTLSPAMTGTSLVPVRVTTTSCGVPSAESTVKVSTLVSPAARYCAALSATV